MILDNIKNILLLSAEDLNDWIEPLAGHPQAYTPNITRLADRSMSFEQAYAAAPACSPSRTATLFGQAPWRSGIYHNRHSWAMAYPVGEKQSIIGQALSAGWTTKGAGKIFHTGKSGMDSADWSDFHQTPADVFSSISDVVTHDLLRPRDDFGPISNESPPLFDDRNLDYIKSTMTKGVQKNLWALGLYRPHLPFIVPQRFFDLIKRPIEPPLGLHSKVFDPKNFAHFNQLPEAARKLARRGIGLRLSETGEYEDFLHAYLASIAYADFLIGELLDHMESTGLLENTMIVFWSDHGWQLGEKLSFRKFTLWERALRVPLMVSIPNGPIGTCREPVSLLDIYPTLLNVIGAAPPYKLDGQDLVPIIYGNQGRNHALSMWERFDKEPKRRSYLAETVRTNQYRLIRYHDYSLELYDHKNDPFEHNNLLLNVEQESDGNNMINLVADLLKLLPQDANPPIKPHTVSHILKARPPKYKETVFII